MQPDTTSHALQPPSLVLVAPMPRRPIALVARRHHHHLSRSRSSRTVSSSATSASSHTPDPSRESAQRTASSSESHVAANSSQPASIVRLVAHPYSRAKTPSNATSISSPASPAAAALAGVSGWPHGLAISSISPPPRHRAASRDGSASRPLSSREGTLASALVLDSPAQASTSDTLVASSADREQMPNEAVSADEPMLASPIAVATAKPDLAMMDVERTPTKTNGYARPNAKQTPQRQHAESVAEDDQQPRSTPTIGAISPRPHDQALALSPVSPTQQRIAAAASASAQLPLAFSSPPAAPGDARDESRMQHNSHCVQAVNTSAPTTPSPYLSDSQSRSPSASPSPSPSPSFAILLDTEPPKHADQPRKMRLPLAPLPTSPIPRKMTRNPFERYLSVGQARNGSACTLHARLVMAMAQTGNHTRSVVDALERSVHEADEEMDWLERSSPSLHRPALVSVNSGASVASRMDVEE